MCCNIIEKIQASGKKAVIVLTGGGAQALEQLLTHPGASRFVLDASIPYSNPALIDYVGEDISKSVCTETAQNMAKAAYERGVRLDPFEPIIGIACTAALQTIRKRKGDDKACFCIKNETRQSCREIEIPSGTRLEQEKFLSDYLIKYIAEFLAV